MEEKDDDRHLHADEHIERVLVNGSIHRGPDPTVLTTEALKEAKETTRLALIEAKDTARYEDAVIRTEILAEIKALEAKLGARLDGMDKATTLQLAEALRYPNAIERSATALRDMMVKTDSALREVHARDMERITTLLSERDKRFAQAEAAALRTNELALAAPSEAVARVEKNTANQQDFNIAQFTQITGRLDRIEGTREGAESQGLRARSNTTLLISVLGVLFIATSVIIAILEATHG